MKIVNIKDFVFRKGEYIVGFDATGSHACYLMYGVIEGDEERELSPGAGHEEIIAVIEGSIELATDTETISVSKGQAIYLKGEEKVRIRSSGKNPAIYVIAGGHSDGSHHH